MKALDARFLETFDLTVELVVVVKTVHAQELPGGTGGHVAVR